MLKDPSPQQSTFFRWVTNGRGSCVLVAVAGAGKTTTIVEAASLIPVHLYCAFVAFNKDIAAHLTTLLPKHIRCMTLNAMGNFNWTRFIGARTEVVDSKVKTRQIILEIVPKEHHQLYGQALIKLVGLAKSVGLVPRGVTGAISLTYDEPEEWYSLMDHHDVEFEEGADVMQGIDYARAVLRRSIDMCMSKKLMDFDDQLYMPVIMRARFWQNDYLFVDEAQDVNKIQRAMLRRALKPNGRLIAVGDPHQAIYGFRGADSQAIENIKKEFGAVELPLTVSYRCPQIVVAEAQQYVSHIQAHPSAPMGVRTRNEAWGPWSFTPSDAILCRNTGPLVEHAYKLIRAGVPCRILGKEIGQGIAALIKKMKASTVKTLIERLDSYFERESAAFNAKNQEEKTEKLAEKIDTIKVFIDQLPETGRTIAKLLASIDAMFSDDNKDRQMLTLCTIHKSKGQEWKRVFVLNEWLMPSKYARQEWQQEQEKNLQYVACTRSKSELHFIDQSQFTLKQEVAKA
jgi:DNA helicase II / ATP-dependent DNA helicase PcrA